MLNSLVGQLLLASPAMDDPGFEHAVILMVEHGEDGALGLVLNRQTDTPVESIWDQISASPCLYEQMLFRGGPCPGPLMLLHDRSPYAQAEVCEGVCFTSDEALVRGVLDEPGGPLRFVLGYAGWSAGQLEQEMSHGGWLVTPATRDVVFDPDADDGLWLRVITGIDRSLAMLAMNPRLMPIDASLN